MYVIGMIPGMYLYVSRVSSSFHLESDAAQTDDVDFVYSRVFVVLSSSMLVRASLRASKSENRAQCILVHIPVLFLSCLPNVR